MIITSDPKEVDQVDTIINRAEVLDDPPPAYFGTQSLRAVDAPLPPIPAAAAPPPVPHAINPTNHLSLSRANGSIKGVYVIDPRIRIPLPMLPSLASDETEATRRHLFLSSTNGGVDVDVWVVGGGDYKGRVKMLAKSFNGGVTIRLHTSDAARPPIHLTATSTNGTVTVHVPHAFRGPLTARTRNGSVQFSAQLTAATTTFNETSGTHRCFVGEFADWADAPGEWLGDEICVETWNGGIKLQYDTEGQGAWEMGVKQKGKGTFIGRLLGL